MESGKLDGAGSFHILLTDDFVGYPLRKDYDVKGPDFGQPLKINLEQEDQIF